MPKKLDRTRNFGTVWGSDDGTCFVQDEIHFDHKGDEIVTKAPAESASAPAARQAATPKAGKTKTAAPAAEAVTAAKKGKKVTPATVPGETTGFSNEDQLNAQSGSGDA